LNEKEIIVPLQLDFTLLDAWKIAVDVVIVLRFIEIYKSLLFVVRKKITGYVFTLYMNLLITSWDFQKSGTERNLFSTTGRLSSKSPNSI
jgi:hypothetical protein